VNKANGTFAIGDFPFKIEVSNLRYKWLVVQNQWAQGFVLIAILARKWIFVIA
jgi:hypothetical protein